MFISARQRLHSPEEERAGTGAAPIPTSVSSISSSSISDSLERGLSALIDVVRHYRFPSGTSIYDSGRSNLGTPVVIKPGSWDQVAAQILPYMDKAYTIAVGRTSEDLDGQQARQDTGSVIAALAALQVHVGSVDSQISDYFIHPLVSLTPSCFARSPAVRTAMNKLGLTGLADHAGNYIAEYYDKGESRTVSRRLRGFICKLFESPQTEGEGRLLSDLNTIRAHFRRLEKITEAFKIMIPDCKSTDMPALAFKIDPRNARPGFMSLRSCQIFLPQLFELCAPRLNESPASEVLNLRTCEQNLSKIFPVSSIMKNLFNIRERIIGASSDNQDNDDPVEKPADEKIKAVILANFREGLRSSMTADFAAGARILLYHS